MHKFLPTTISNLPTGILVARVRVAVVAVVVILATRMHGMQQRLHIVVLRTLWLMRGVIKPLSYQGEISPC
nr:MAG TPA: hypothetical protein [Caudoviricetes sp.]